VRVQLAASSHVMGGFSFPQAHVAGGFSFPQPVHMSWEGSACPVEGSACPMEGSACPRPLDSGQVEPPQGEMKLADGLAGWSLFCATAKCQPAQQRAARMALCHENCPMLVQCCSLECDPGGLRRATCLSSVALVSVVKGMRSAACLPIPGLCSVVKGMRSVSARPVLLSGVWSRG